MPSPRSLPKRLCFKFIHSILLLSIPDTTFLLDWQFSISSVHLRLYSTSSTMFSRTPRALVSARPSLRLARVSQTSTPAAVQRFQARNRALLSSSEACSSRSFHSSSVVFKGITPESSDPPPPKSQTISANEPSYVVEASPLTDQQYREYSEHYINVLLSELEKAQEEGSDLEAEYAVC